MALAAVASWLRKGALPVCQVELTWLAAHAAGLPKCRIAASSAERRPGGSRDPALDAATDRRRLRWLLIGLLGAMVLVLAAVTWRQRMEVAAARARSSCSTAMRGVDFCAPMEHIGLFELASSADACCAMCDEAAGCQAWSFAAGRCWRMRFTEGPCNGAPGNPECRCHTCATRVGGFKPASGPVTWARRGLGR